MILPQAIPPVIPALGNYLIGMFKDTPLLATITVLELLGTRTRPRPVEPSATSSRSRSSA